MKTIKINGEEWEYQTGSKSDGDNYTSFYKESGNYYNLFWGLIKLPIHYTFRVHKNIESAVYSKEDIKELLESALREFKSKQARIEEIKRGEII